MSSFTVRSAAGVLVSLLNPVGSSPVDSPSPDLPSPSDDPSQATPVRKKHTCAECGRLFSSAGHLNRHLTVHTGEKKHLCPFPGCGKTASRADNLVQHYRLHLPKGEHNRCTSYVHTRMDEKVEEMGGFPVQKPRRRGAQPPLSPRPTLQLRRDSMLSDSSMPSLVLAPPLMGPSDRTMSFSPSPALLTPMSETAPVFDFSRKLPVSNAREEC